MYENKSGSYEYEFMNMTWLANTAKDLVPCTLQGALCSYARCKSTY